jgi:hypothetical protein
LHRTACRRSAKPRSIRRASSPQTFRERKSFESTLDCYGLPRRLSTSARQPGRTSPTPPTTQLTHEKMKVTVPQGMQGGGMPLHVQCPGGIVQVQVPPGLQPGMTFEIMAPVPVQPTVQPTARPPPMAQPQPAYAQPEPNFADQLAAQPSYPQPATAQPRPAGHQPRVQQPMAGAPQQSAPQQPVMARQPPSAYQPPIQAAAQAAQPGTQVYPGKPRYAGMGNSRQPVYFDHDQEVRRRDLAWLGLT